MAIPIGQRRHLVTFQNPGPAVPDGDGGFAQTWTDLVPASGWVAIVPATAKDLERVTADTVLAAASHILTGPYHPQVTTQTRVTFGTRTFSVTGVSNREERNIEMVLVCTEVVP
jgi:SPP1 family predicted phage head-tail adaptor